MNIKQRDILSTGQTRVLESSYKWLWARMTSPVFERVQLYICSKHASDAGDRCLFARKLQIFRNQQASAQNFDLISPCGGWCSLQLLYSLPDSFSFIFLTTSVSSPWQLLFHLPGSFCIVYLAACLSSSWKLLYPLPDSYSFILLAASVSST